MFHCLIHSIENLLIKFNTTWFMFGAKHDIKYRLFSCAIMIIEIWGLCTWVFEYCTQCTVHFLRVRSYSMMCAACGAGMSSFSGELLHSHAYRETPDSARFRWKRVAVVGFGNSVSFSTSNSRTFARRNATLYSLHYRL